MPLLLLFSVAALAQHGASMSRQLFETAVARYGVADFEASIAALKKARAQTKDPQLLAQIALYLGANHQVLGQEKAAQRAFRSALEHDPALVVDPARFKRTIIDGVARARAGMQGKLEVTCALPGAEVRVDGKRAGLTPLQLVLPVGRHFVEVRAPRAGGSFARTVVIALGKTERVTAIFAPTSAPTTIEAQAPSSLPASLPEGAQPGERRSRARLWTWISAGASLAALGAGIGFGLSADADYDIYRAEETGPLRATQLADGIEDKSLAANLLFAGAGALAVTAVVLFFLEGDKEAAAGVRGDAKLSPTLSLGGLGVTGRF